MDPSRAIHSANTGTAELCASDEDMVRSVLNMNRRVLFVVIALGVIGLSAFIVFRSRPVVRGRTALSGEVWGTSLANRVRTETALAAPDSANGAYDYLFETKKITASSYQWYEVEAEYPQLRNPRFPNEVALNNMIKNLVLADVTKFREHEKQVMSARKTPGLDESLEIEYEVIAVRNDVYSIKFTHRVMSRGQMHPIDYPVTVNYDLALERPIQLRDIFKPNSKYLTAISKYSYAELQRRYGDNFMMKDGTAPKAENFEHWNLTPEGLLISFDDYQVGPHAMGQPVLLIPYAALEEFRVDEKILHRMINSDSDEGHTCSKPAVVVQHFA